MRKLARKPARSAATPISGGTVTDDSRLTVTRRPTTLPWAFSGTDLACKENKMGWISPCAPPRNSWAISSTVKMPPSSGVTAISAMAMADKAMINQCALNNRR